MDEMALGCLFQGLLYCVTMLCLLIGIVCAAIVVCVPVFEWLNFCAHLVRLRCELNSAKTCAGLPSGEVARSLGKCVTCGINDRRLSVPFSCLLALQCDRRRVHA